MGHGGLKLETDQKAVSAFLFSSFLFFYIKKKEGSNFKEELKDIKHIFKEASQRLWFFKG